MRGGCRQRAHSDRGSGSVLALALLAVTAVVALAAVALAMGLAVKQRVVGAADAAALAAADAARGLIPGIPCELGAEIASVNGAVLEGCTLTGDIVTVDVSGSWAGIRLLVRAAAGPPAEAR